MPLKVVSRSGSKILWLNGTVCGQPVRDSTGTRDPKLAEERRAAREAEIYRAHTLGVAASKSFAAIAISYLKRDRSDDTKHRIGRFLAWLKSTSRMAVTGNQVGQELLDEACEAMLRAGASDATRLREITGPVRAVLRHGAIRGWCRLPMFESIRQPRRRREWLSPAEAKTIIAAAPANLAAIFIFMFCTGARRAEALSLDWKIRPAPVRPGYAARRQSDRGRCERQDH